MKLRPRVAKREIIFGHTAHSSIYHKCTHKKALQVYMYVPPHTESSIAYCIWTHTYAHMYTNTHTPTKKKLQLIKHSKTRCTECLYCYASYIHTYTPTHTHTHTHTPPKYLHHCQRPATHL